MFSGQKIELEDFEAAAMPHFDDLYRTAARVIGDRTEAEDLVQEAYLQGWKSFHRFEPGTNCRAWLFKILFHVIYHHRRKWFSLNLVKDGDDLLEERLAYEPPISEHLTDEDILAALEKIPTFRAQAVRTNFGSAGFLCQQRAAGRDQPRGSPASGRVHVLLSKTAGHHANEIALAASG